MLSIICRTTIGAMILLIMPVSLWIFDWNWNLDQYKGWLKIMYWITKTATNPWSIIIHVILYIWFLRLLRLHLYSAIIIFIIFSAVIMAGQGIKSWIKDIVQEPRPIVVWLEKTYHIPVGSFCNLNYKYRCHLMKEQLLKESNIPNFISRYWQKDTEFAFPSGHAIFTVSWALLSVGLLWPYRYRLTVITLLTWAVSVMGSRLLLGMHWLKDLVCSIFISWLLATYAVWIIQRFFLCFNHLDIKINYRNIVK